MIHRPALLVEDDENDVFFFERAWKTVGVASPLHVARDGKAAIARLSDGSQPDSQFPCLVILDLNLPFRNGFDVLQWIRESAPNPLVPVIVLTSSISDSDMAKAYQLGANSYLAKPTQPDDLVKLLQSFSDFWFQYNRVPGHCELNRNTL